ncbi:adenosine kinase-like isoform X2 [Anneissia japonica]|uniref:adenosine kinase-like isoform X2 n=1 Tax=Anneissia japonica TaxID=1529436 RepID=UPI0014255112|nr:adenosine kinase-like isoform X2 [Anneissia japonica]
MISEGILFGLGNPLLDISTPVTQEFLDKYELKADNAILAEDIHKPMYIELVKKFKVDYIPGGATLNSLRVAQWIIGEPNRATFFGCVGKDDFAKTLLEKAKEDGVNVHYDINEEEATGTCAVLITGSNRSLCANLAAANCYTIEHLEKTENWAYVEKASFYYSAGFHLTVNPKAMLKIAKHAFENKKTYCLNLSAPFLSQFFKDPMMEILPYVDFMFGNETEALQFAKDQNYETEDLKEIVKKIAAEKKISEQARVVVITQGADNTLVCKEGELKEYPVIKIADKDIVDTNGAGDAFVGGFLAQLVQGKDIEQCIKCANYAANYVIKQSGTSINDKPDFE